MAWMTSTISTGIPALICMRPAPARIAPKRSAASTMPTGWARPSRATVIESNPTFVPYEAFMKWVMPRICHARRRARPAGPHRDIVRMIRKAGRIPA